MGAVVGRMMASKHVYFLIPETYGYLTLYGKRNCD